MYDILSEEDIKKCSMFLINFIYADKTSLTISQARSKKWKAMKNKTTLRLPPDEDSFKQHLLRANYQAQIWYIFANPDAPSMSLDHGYRQECLLVLPTPHTKEACPNSLRRLVNDETFESDDDKSNDDGDSLCYSSSSDDDSTVFIDFLKCLKYMIYTRCSFHCSFILTIHVWKVLQI